MNNVILIGRVFDIQEVMTKDGVRNISIILAIPRPFKNFNGEYENDYIQCRLIGNFMSNIENLKKGSVISVKGRLQCSNYQNMEMEVIAEKISFISSRENEENGG